MDARPHERPRPRTRRPALKRPRLTSLRSRVGGGSLHRPITWRGDEVHEQLTSLRVPYSDFPIVAAAGQAFCGSVIRQRIDHVLVAGESAHQFRLFFVELVLANFFICGTTEDLIA